MLIEHLLCAVTVIDIGATALNGGNKKPLSFGFHSRRRYKHTNKSNYIWHVRWWYILQRKLSRRRANEFCSDGEDGNNTVNSVTNASKVPIIGEIWSA